MTYNPGQCTYWVQHMAATEGWSVPGEWHDAYQWLDSARADGLIVDDTPAVGSIAVWAANTAGASSSGHVAYVVGVEGGTITVSEENWPEGSGPSTRSCPATDPAGFIHSPGEPMTADQELKYARGVVESVYLACRSNVPESVEALDSWAEKIVDGDANALPGIIAEMVASPEFSADLEKKRQELGT